MEKTIPYIIGITGPSGTGKSSVARRICEAYPDIVLTIPMDNYFKDIHEFPLIHGVPNWEVPENIRFDLLIPALRTLKEGNSAHVFHVSHTGEHLAEVVTPTPIIVVEGFLLLHSEEMRELLDISIYLDAPVELQLERRFERQSKRWKGDLGDLRFYISEVVVGQYKHYGLPTKEFATHIISSQGSPKEVFGAINTIINTIPLKVPVTEDLRTP